MPYRRRSGPDAVVFHVINRAARRMSLFQHDWDYRLFLDVLAQAQQRVPVRLLSYCVMPNHFHFVVWSETEPQLSSFMRWMTATHSKRWHSSHATTGTGPLYQGRFKSLPVQTNSYLVNACRYVERNPVRARLVPRAESWRWSSLGGDCKYGNPVALHPWPIPKPSDWCALVNTEQPDAELADLRQRIRVSAPYGDESWCGDLGCHPRGGPRV